MRDTYQQLARVVPQSDRDANRLARLGAPLSAPVGNLKFDSAVNPSLQTLGQRWRHGLTRPVVMLASAREGEEALFLDALEGHPEAHKVNWLLVPRHPQRFDEVAQLAQQRGFLVARRTDWEATGPSEVAVGDKRPVLWLGDTLGEMPAYYSLAHCTLMGGTYLPFGGQNLIEACLYACPVLLGPSTFNFALAAENALTDGAARQFGTLAQALAGALALVGDAAQLAQMQSRASQFAHLHSGASLRTVQALGHLWPPVRCTGHL
jgi:3-deoxy-D-manno-octulosonic-acid transferase